MLVFYFPIKSVTTSVLFSYKVCDYKNMKVRIGETIKSGDNCNTCTCKPNGRLSCTDKTCCK